MGKENEVQYSVLTEQGDLGLGVHKLNEEENKKVNEQQKKEKQNKH